MCTCFVVLCWNCLCNSFFSQEGFGWQGRLDVGSRKSDAMKSNDVLVDSAGSM